MIGVEQTTLTLLLILTIGLVVPDLFRRFKLPFVTSIILVGAALGPHGLDYIQSNEVIEFFGFLGSAFLMLMAGLEVKLEHFKELEKKIFIMAALNGVIPFIAGIWITLSFGYSFITAMLIGTVFISSSVVVVMSSLRSSKLINKDIGRTIISAVILEDMFSLLTLAFIMQGVSPITNFPLPIYIIILVSSIILLKKFLPRIAGPYLRRRHSERYEKEFRFVLVILMGVLVYFSALGVHPIVAAFVVGLLLSDVVTSEILISKLHTIGYGMFVPVFFFIIGMQLDLGVVTNFEYINGIMILIICGLILAKILSGYFAGKLAGFNQIDSWIFGAASTPQLTTTLAVTYAAAELEILDTVLTTSIILLAVITTVLAPLMLHALVRFRRRHTG